MSQRYLYELFTKRVPTRGFLFNGADFGNSDQADYLFMKKFHRLCLDNRLEKYPLFWSPISRLSRT